MSAASSGSFWESSEAVSRFEAREPDVRMVELLEDLKPPSGVRVLDLGCAAGRNTVALAVLGYDVYAVDASRAMVTRTRERVAEIAGAGEAERRVIRGSMADLGEFDDGCFHLVIALGVLHQAADETEWRSAVAEIARVLRPGGRALVAAWSPRSRPEGVALVRVPGQEGVYEGFHSGRHYLVDAAALDREMEARGLTPAIPTEEVEVATGAGYRVTVNGLYRKGGRA
jgi:SAM-dependent methyltransferase